MAEALAQAPSRTHTAPQLSVKLKSQRREKLAIKQSRQLIPVTPSMPKGLVSQFRFCPHLTLKLVVLPCSPKSKLFSLIYGLQVLNLVDKLKAKPAVRTSDMSITVKGRQQQYGWENGVSSPSQKDVASPMINANSKVATSQHAVAVESAGGMHSTAGFTVEKRPSLAQTRSRNDFAAA
ncbi:hypothetical protein GQ457_01G011950 [Hibiscus cannabinus]